MNIEIRHSDECECDKCTGVGFPPISETHYTTPHQTHIIYSVHWNKDAGEWFVWTSLRGINTPYSWIKWEMSLKAWNLECRLYQRQSD